MTETRPWRRSEPIQRQKRRGAGFAWMASGALFLSLMSVLVRLSNGSGAITAYHTTFFRFFIGGVAVGAFVLARGKRFRIVNWPWLIARGVLGAGAALIYFHCIGAIGLSRGTILSFTYPVWSATLAWLVIGERVPRRIWIGVATAFAGVCLVILPRGQVTGIAWVDLLALTGGLVGGVSILTAKRVRETDSAVATFLSLAAFSSAFTVVPALRGVAQLDAKAWPILLAIGVAGTLANMMIAYAVKHIRATEAALWTLLVPVISGILGVVLFHEEMLPRTFVGGMLVILSCAYVAAGPRRASHPISAPHATTSASAK